MALVCRLFRDLLDRGEERGCWKQSDKASSPVTVPRGTDSEVTVKWKNYSKASAVDGKQQGARKLF